MSGKKLRVLSLIAAAVSAGLSGHAFAQYTIAGSYSIGDTQSTVNPAIYGNPGTDDTGPNQTGNAVTYGSMLLQSYASPSQAVTPGTYIQTAGSPYAIGTLGAKIVTGSGFQGLSSSTTTTAFYYSPTTGFHYFGQYNTSTSIQYVDTGATTNWSSGSPSSTFVSDDLHFINLSAENAVGQAIGSEQINSLDSTTSGINGQHAFLFNIPTNTGAGLGLTGTAIGGTGASYAANFNYSNTSSTVVHSTYQSSAAVSVDDLGNASGTSARYFAFGGDSLASSPGGTGTLGTSTWFFNGTTNTETGLYGPGYSYQKTLASLAGTTDGGTGTFASNADRGVKGGFEVGTATVYVDTGDSVAHTAGADGWLYAGGTTTPIGLYNSGITPGVAGSPLSYSYSFPVTFNNSANTIAYTGNSRSTSITALSSRGFVGGTSTLYQAASGSLSKGTDAWIYTPTSPTTGTYRQVGFVSNGFASGGTTSFVSSAAFSPSFARASSIAYINAGGSSVGTSTEYLSSGAGGTGTTGSTNIAWFAPSGGPSVQIGPTDANHTAVSATLGSFVNNTVAVLTDGGYVGGSSTRYLANSTTTNGTDAWVYNSDSNALYILDPNPNSTTAFTSQISYISPQGVAVGEYKVGTNSFFQAFAWSALSGFIDLSSVTPQTDPNITEFADAISYNPATGTIITTGNYLSGGNSGTVVTPGGGVAFLSGAPLLVPEPTSLCLLGSVTAFGVLSRRRRAGGGTVR